MAPIETGHEGTHVSDFPAKNEITKQGWITSGQGTCRRRLGDL